MHHILRPVFVFALGLSCVCFVGCNPNSYIAKTNPGDNQTTETSTQNQAGRNQAGQNLEPPLQPPNLLMGTFNIQMFGKTKMSRPNVVKVLVDIVRKFDILAVQELRDGDEWVVKEFLEILNKDGHRYAASVGPKQGYVIKGKLARYYEQAIFFYDTTKVELLSPTYVAEDPNQVMHRAPYVGHFRTINVPAEQAFSFVLMNVHVDPDVVHNEFQALQDIINGIYLNHRGEDDFILIGDLNDEPHRYARYGWMQAQFSALPSTIKTNTAMSKCYDNLVFDANYTAEFTQDSGVLNLMEVYGLPVDQAMKVSDHMPVWANFSALEAPQAAMTQGDPQDVIR